MLLKSGWHLVMFPEGTRSLDGGLQPFQRGVGHLAQQTGAPVIPMHVAGTHRIMPKGQAIPLPGPASVRIGRALLPARGEGSRRFTERIEHAVRELAEGSQDPEVRGTWIERWRALAPPQSRRR
jgi:1-acyl-sn-glycerol-3-phosphate acyltransferase